LAKDISTVIDEKTKGLRAFKKHLEEEKILENVSNPELYGSLFDDFVLPPHKLATTQQRKHITSAIKKRSIDTELQVKSRLCYSFKNTGKIVV